MGALASFAGACQRTAKKQGSCVRVRVRVCACACVRVCLEADGGTDLEVTGVSSVAFLQPPEPRRRSHGVLSCNRVERFQIRPQPAPNIHQGGRRAWKAQVESQFLRDAVQQVSMSRAHGCPENVLEVRSLKQTEAVIFIKSMASLGFRKMNAPDGVPCDGLPCLAAPSARSRGLCQGPCCV